MLAPGPLEANPKASLHPDPNPNANFPLTLSLSLTLTLISILTPLGVWGRAGVRAWGRTGVKFFNQRVRLAWTSGSRLPVAVDASFSVRVLSR